MVLLSLALQLFLLFAGNVRRRRRVGGLKFFVWLAYLSSYAVAASAIGLLSRYEDKYKLRSLESCEHLHTSTMPFLWAPFLLLHLGGPDTITAFSIEDSNLWTRQLINLAFQLSLALYVFWKSFDLLDLQLLAVAVPLFVAGIIKYGERIWALKSGSRDDLMCHVKKEPTCQEYDLPPPGDVVESCALRSMLSGRELLVGGKVCHLSDKDSSEFMGSFCVPNDKLEFVLMELGMIYDMLYTKVMVLQSWTGGVFRCIVLVVIMVAFVLFWVSQHHLHAHGTTNAVITYTLFVVSICVEIYSMFMVIASPWTRARSKQGTFLFWLSNKLSCQGLPSPSMGQFNPIDYSISTKSRPKSISKVFEALGLEKHWRNFWYASHIEDKVMVDYIVGLLNFEHNPSGERSHNLELGEELQFWLTMPFEICLFRLHIYTEKHLITLPDDASHGMKLIAAQCRELSNYLMYLLVMYPSMLSLTNDAQHLLPTFAKWVRENHGNLTKAGILERYASTVESPFEGQASMKSLKDMKELWARLLIYAAGKCPMELHARQLGDGLELLTVVGSILIHCGTGDAGSNQLILLAPTPPQERPSQKRFVQNQGWINVAVLSKPFYAFEFSQYTMSLGQHPPPLCVQAWAGDKRKEPERQQPLAQFRSQTYTFVNRIRRPQFAERWMDSSSSPQGKPRRADIAAEIEQDVARRREAGIRYRAVTGTVQMPQGHIERCLSF